MTARAAPSNEAVEIGTAALTAPSPPPSPTKGEEMSVAVFTTLSN